ncbi:MAG: SPOR domain-containing protein [Candidatus Binatia bacterium]
MAENWRERGHGLYYFSRGQLIVLAVGFIVTSVVVFFLGILIGQGIEERKLLKKEEPLVKIPLRPLPQGSGLAPGAPAKEEMTFYDTLAKPPTGSQPTRGEPTKESKPVQKSPGAEGAKADSGTRGGVWAVQVNAYPHERDAKRLARKLKDKGYDAYVVSTRVKGRIWHRVRVGHLETRAHAKELQKTLKTKEKFTKAITVSR